MRKKYRIISAEGYPLYDSTLREPFNASYILACLERTLQCGHRRPREGFQEQFARKAKSDLIAYERLRAKREAELEELYTRPFEDIAVEEFLDQLPKPQKRWILPARRGRMPMLRWIPLVSKQEQGTYLRVRCLNCRNRSS